MAISVPVSYNSPVSTPADGVPKWLGWLAQLRDGTARGQGMTLEVPRLTKFSCTENPGRLGLLRRL